MVTPERQAEIDKRKKERLEREKLERQQKISNVAGAFGIDIPTEREPTPPPVPTQPEPTTTQPQEPQQPTNTKLTTPEILTNEAGEPIGVNLPDGRQFIGIDRDQIQQIVDRETQKTAPIAGAAPAGTAQEAATQQIAGQELAGQVGQIDQLGVSPTGLNVDEAFRVGLVDAIPEAIRLAGTGFIAGGLFGGGAGTAVAPGIGTGAGATAGAIIGGATGFVAGMAGSIKSSFSGQRRDTTTAQQRVLDEGKQTMKDWATLAKNDPVNKAQYLSEYNNVASQIDQAYRQMKLDTSLDVAKFETALPNLAEFESFYAVGGERDTLDVEMRNSLITPAPLNYDMLELANRRGNGSKT